MRGNGVPNDEGCCLRGTWRGLDWALTLAMRKEVVSERGGRAGVIISGPNTVTAEG